MMRSILSGLVFALMAASAALAQTLAPPVEDVTVTGTKSHRVIESFVKSVAKPNRLTGKIARWQEGICPVVDGFPPAIGKVLVEHLREVAASVGAPVNNQKTCEPNIQIVFSRNPQALLDDIHKTAPDLLGYFDNADQRTQAAQMVRPIQAWYTTETIDLRGQVHVDSTKSGGVMIRISPKQPPIIIPHAIASEVTGSRLGDGIRSAFYRVLIMVNPDQLKDHDMVAQGDYIAMVALSQLDSLDVCQQLPSIVNMLARNCSDKTPVMTSNDTGYLHGLYKSSPDSNLNFQQDAIAYQMEQAANGR